MKIHANYVRLIIIVLFLTFASSGVSAQIPNLLTRNLDTVPGNQTNATFRELIGRLGGVSNDDSGVPGTVILKSTPSARRILGGNDVRSNFPGRIAVGVLDFREALASGKKHLWLLLAAFDPDGKCPNCLERILTVFEMGIENARLLDAATIVTDQDVVLSKTLALDPRNQALVIGISSSNVTSVNSISVVALDENRVVVLLEKFLVRNIYRCDQSIEESASVRMLPAGRRKDRRLQIVVTVLAESPRAEGEDSRVTYRGNFRYVFGLSKGGKSFTAVTSPERSHRRAFEKNAPCGVVTDGFRRNAASSIRQVTLSSKATA